MSVAQHHTPVVLCLLALASMSQTGVSTNILVQQHFDGSSFFQRTWNEFKAGFGDTSSDYWLGNDRLHTLTQDGKYRLRIELHHDASQLYFAEYDTFIVGDESTNYTLTVGGFSGNVLQDSMYFHNGMKFSTKDRNNVAIPSQLNVGHLNCAQSYGGGFWYFWYISGVSCAMCGVNGAGNWFLWYNMGMDGEYRLRTSRMWLVSLESPTTTPRAPVASVWTAKPAKPTKPPASKKCFTGSSTVTIQGGQQVLMSDLKVGDEVLTAAESTDGEVAGLRYAPVIAFFSRDLYTSTEFVEIVTAAGHKLTLTPSHLVYVAAKSAPPRMIFAADAKVGDFVFAAGDETATRDEIVGIRVVQLSEGVYAPLTTSGTIVVDGIMCSCYAEFSSHRLKHLAMLPMRVYYYTKSALVGSSIDVAHSNGTCGMAECNVDHGIHWYAGQLHLAYVSILAHFGAICSGVCLY